MQRMQSKHVSRTSLSSNIVVESLPVLLQGTTPNTTEIKQPIGQNDEDKRIMTLPLGVAILASMILLQAQSCTSSFRMLCRSKQQSAKHLDSLVGVLSLDDWLVWKFLQTQQSMAS